MIISPRSSHSPHCRVIESCVNFLFHITFHSDPFSINWIITKLNEYVHNTVSLNCHVYHNLSSVLQCFKHGELNTCRTVTKRNTWNGVVQYETKEATDKHAGCQKYLQDLIKFYHTWTQCKQLDLCLNDQVFWKKRLVKIFCPPVEIALEFFNIQFGITRPVNMEKPKMKMFRDEFMSAYWKCDPETKSS